MIDQVTLQRDEAGDWFVRTFPPFVPFWCRLMMPSQVHGQGPVSPPKHATDAKLRRAVEAWLGRQLEVWRNVKTETRRLELGKSWHLVVRRRKPLRRFFLDPREP